MINGATAYNVIRAMKTKWLWVREQREAIYEPAGNIERHLVDVTVNKRHRRTTRRSELNCFRGEADREQLFPRVI